MKKVISFARLNKLNKDARKRLVLDKYFYFQVFHDCLYCYKKLKEIKCRGKVYKLDRNGELKVYRNKIVNKQLD